MLVDLVATSPSVSISANKFPAMLNQNAENVIQCDDTIPGSHHCLLSLVDGQLMVWDLGTPGGTLVNGTCVSKATVKAGDTLSLAGTSFKVNYRQRPQRYLRGARS
jgi:pSer/pThr/pTyr-binding forkhead associated (FHA) protein